MINIIVVLIEVLILFNFNNVNNVKMSFNLGGIV